MNFESGCGNNDARHKLFFFSKRIRLTGSQTERSDVQKNYVFKVSSFTRKDASLDCCSDGNRFISFGIEAQK